MGKSGPNGKDLSPLTPLTRDVVEYGWRNPQALLYTTAEGGVKEDVCAGG